MTTITIDRALVERAADATDADRMRLTLEQSVQLSRELRAALAQSGRAEAVAHQVIAGALFDWLSWMASRDEPILLCSRVHAGHAIESLREWAKLRGLSMRDARALDWQSAAPPPPAPPEEWVACSERMPEPDVEVLVMLATPQFPGDTRYRLDTWSEQRETLVSFSTTTVPVGMGWDSGEEPEDVTHWMALPTPPQQGE